jgi:hypothetical protein
MAADHEFHGTISAQPAAEADHLTQLDAAVAGATNRANHTGTQGTDTIDGLDALVDTRVQTVVDATPAALDTLRELAEALRRPSSVTQYERGQCALHVVRARRR